MSSYSSCSNSPYSRSPSYSPYWCRRSPYWGSPYSRFWSRYSSRSWSRTSTCDCSSSSSEYMSPYFDEVDFMNDDETLESFRQLFNEERLMENKIRGRSHSVSSNSSKSSSGRRRSSSCSPVFC